MVALINRGTLEEEKDEEPAKHLLRCKRTRNEGNKRGESSLVKDNIPKPLPEELQPRTESEPVQQEPATEKPVR